MIFILSILMSYFIAGVLQKEPEQGKVEVTIVHELFRFRNEHKADSAELYFSDTVLAYMKYLRNVPKKKITQSDKSFWRSHPQNKFEITEPVQITVVAGITTATIIGKEYLDGKAFQYEKIQIEFDRDNKINSFRGVKLKKK